MVKPLAKRNSTGDSQTCGYVSRVFSVEVFVPVGRSSDPWMLSKPLPAQVKAALLALGELPSVPEKGSKRASTCGPRVHVGDPLELSYFAIAWCAIASAQ
jgi:hypothetical protein